MPRVTPQQELDFLAELMDAEPGGMGIDAISQKTGRHPSAPYPAVPNWMPCMRATLCGLASGRWNWRRGRASIVVVSEG